ncbi:MAG: winged helix-turn-helix domain-containing protein [Planctomycetota bacterium]|jgi:DNA-binding transcriptional ArsR family regulator
MPEIDPHIHQPTRLRIMMVLSGLERADFAFLKSTLGLTNGNLSAHMSRLEEAGYVAIEKAFKGKTPHTSYRLTANGRSSLEDYWEAMDAIRCLAD